MTTKKDDPREVTKNDADTTTGDRMATSAATSTAPKPLTVTLDPTSGPEQTPVTITGTEFGDVAGTLALNEVPAPVLVWTPLAIQTSVPYGAKSGELVVTTTDGRRGAAAFTVTEP